MCFLAFGLGVLLPQARRLTSGHERQLGRWLFATKGADLYAPLERRASRTPGPPPFSGINSIPAPANARQIASTVRGFS